MECWGGPALGGNQLCCREDLRSWGYVWCPQLCCWGWRSWGWEVEGIVATHGSLLGDSFATFIIGSTLQTFQRKMIHHSTCMKWVYLILHWYCYCFCWVCAMYETHFNLWLVGSSNIRGDMWWHGDALRFKPITDAGTLKIEASSQDSCLDEAVLWCSAKKNKQLPIRHLEATSWLLRIFSWFLFIFWTSSSFFQAIWLIKKNRFLLEPIFWTCRFCVGHFPYAVQLRPIHGALALWHRQSKSWMPSRIPWVGGWCWWQGWTRGGSFK